MMAKERIFLSPPHMSGREQFYIDEAFETNWIAPLGPNVDAFEREIAEYTGALGAAALSSGTAAIHIALSLLNIGPGDRVFCSSFTFIASANPVRYVGAEPVFIDSEPQTWNMSPEALERAFEDADREGRLPKAVIVVHLYGQSAKMNEILAVCNRYEVPVIEDAAESLGSTYEGKASGTLGKFGIYSFNGNKIITTSGGGMIVSDDEEALSRARFLATQARDQAPHYQHSVTGYNYRLSNLLAGVGRAQLQVLEERMKARRTIFENYRAAFGELKGIEFMPELPNTRSNRWLTALTIDEEEAAVKISDLLQALAADNIEARPLWKPLHLQPVFEGSRFYPHSETLSVSERLFQSGICLPSGSSLSLDQQQRVIDCIRRSLGKVANPAR
ncbi:aminotransferase class I/II-fold pyridoxal phosphate-dependent enzyme [Paenibacillus rhizophilus]|uniref:Aminotransferase class I/II-fold pyridoxal phosphate-dependent enzyme n=1 Tax=Paenibacillus rhizophilus TaxID=1850366 RepID=A0A3N9PW82_9BACL|nr:aminotransferase class I/II-fold pyridoxal phosphate-dependent enzyme [Paenibacillus rhizophilus]RQW10682.1 aminotransferase class I/II-fold pyridoxal phosphate-dependent enzyme [Paenibacillus rhizophilus]